MRQFQAAVPSTNSSRDTSNNVCLSCNKDNGFRVLTSGHVRACVCGLQRTGVILLVVMALVVNVVINEAYTYIPPNCLQPADRGTCAGNYYRYYYNKNTRSCQQFTYSGCGGNYNRTDFVLFQYVKYFRKKKLLGLYFIF
ncbi:Tissue factor pathway inhibitor 2 [Bulinus truncatus]|nr:Tissue factor pathway inhibitor 2 [Bulinus truncatus]